MPELSLDQAYALALQHHKAGQLAEAEALYRQILAVDPRQTDTLHNLSVLAHQAGHTAAALELIEQALSLRPAWAEALSNRGEFLRTTGNLNAAIDSYRQALAAQPDFVQATQNLCLALLANNQPDDAIAALQQGLKLSPNNAALARNLGEILWQQNRGVDAMAAFQQALDLDPRQSDVWLSIGNIYSARDEIDNAIAAYRQAIAVQPDSGPAYSNLGNALTTLGSYAEAQAAHEQALALAPQHPGVYLNYGFMLQKAKRYSEAMQALRRALELKPDLVIAYINIGGIQKQHGQFDEALASYRQAIACQPESDIAHCSVANLLKDLGQAEAALPVYRHALALRPGNSDIHSDLLLCLHYGAAHDPAECAAEHRRWATAHAAPLPRLPFENINRDPERRLRIGYVSPDFREHAVARLLWPLWAQHDRGQFELYAYAQENEPDELTNRFRARADHWRSIQGVSDSQVAEQIRADRIDILVDLSGHTANNRMLLFARKPAPLQVSFLGYPNTTGLPAVDYRLTDAYADPPDETEAWHTEELVRLEPSAWCIELPAEPPPIARREGPLTFGCFNNLAKVSEPMLQLWSKILRRVPGSRLLLKTSSLSSVSNRARILKLFQNQGIAAERIELQAHSPSYTEHLAMYQRLDIALDPSPYHGTVSTCEALWMGVPVVTLAGPSHVSRVGVSLLSNVGLPELIAHSPEEYCDLAVALANDTERLQALRATLRARMQASPLRDAAGYARNVEKAYRWIWRRYCALGNP